MYYFDNQYLKQYLQTGQNISVLVDKEWLALADESDVESSIEGIGYNTSGKDNSFNYKNIEAVKIGTNIFTLDQLNQKLDPDAAAEKPDTGSKDDSKEITIDPDKKDKKESINKNDYVRNTDPKSPYYRTRGSVVSINDGVVVYKTYADNTFLKVSCLLEHIKKE